MVALGALIGSLLLFNAHPAVAGEDWGLLTPAQRHAYHACLFEAWIENYCYRTSFGYYSQCVIANGGGRYPLDGRWFSQDYCWATAQGLSPR